MLDAALRQLIDPPLDRLGAALGRRGVSANWVTAAGLSVGLAAVPALAVQRYGLALALIIANRALDGIDGAVARSRGPTDFGGYLDIVSDFIFYSAVVLGFALARPEDAPWACFLVFSFMGTASSFLAFAILAAKHGLDTTLRGRKSIYYLGGLTEGTETILFFAAMCLWPAGFAMMAAVFGALCWITTATRVLWAWDSFGRTAR